MIGLKRFEVISNNYLLDKEELHNKLYPVAIDFKDLTVIVGPNGSGKTQFIKAITKLVTKDYGYKEYKVKFDATPGTKFMCFDEEYYNMMVDNPPESEAHYYSNEFMRKALRNWMSKGEGQLDLLDTILPEEIQVSNIVMAYDEPDHNLDFKNQVILYERLKKYSKDNQVIVITHSPVVIAKAGEVFDMESKSWVNSKEYLGRYGI